MGLAVDPDGRLGPRRATRASLSNVVEIQADRGMWQGKQPSIVLWLLNVELAVPFLTMYAFSRYL